GDQAELADRVAADLPRGGERRHLGGEPLRGAEASGRDHQPLEPEPLVGERHPVALGADQVGHGHPDVGEGDDRVVVADRVRVRGGADHAHPGARQVHEEHGVLAVVRAAHQLGLEEGEVGGVERGDVPFDAVEQVAVAVPAGGRLDGRHVGPRVLLGDRVALLALAADGGQDVAVDLVGRGHRGQPGRGSGHRPGERVGHPAHLFLDQYLLQGRAPAAAELLGHVRRAEPKLAGPHGVASCQICGQLAACQLSLLLVRDHLVRERASTLLDVEVVFGQPVHRTPRRWRPVKPRGEPVLTDCSVYVSIGLVPMTSPGHPGSADAVGVGGGAIGGWCGFFLRRAGLDRVVLLEKGLLGQGASSRAAGVVRMQGGTPTAVRLGQGSRRFYLGQRDELRIDSGFVAQGYLLPCFTEAEVAAARERMDMQASLGVPVRWLRPAEGAAANPPLAPGQALGGTFCDDDGYITPPRNVTAYAVALALSGVRVCEQVRFTGLGMESGRGPGVETPTGRISTPLVVLTGGPKLAEVGALAGIRIPAGGGRHEAPVTEPHPDLRPARLPMVFDLMAGLYWRPEEGGLLFGMSNPDELPGENVSVDEGYLARMRERLAALVPVTAGLGLRRTWA